MLAAKGLVTLAQGRYASKSNFAIGKEVVAGKPHITVFDVSSGLEEIVAAEGKVGSARRRDTSSTRKEKRTCLTLGGARNGPRIGKSGCFPTFVGIDRSDGRPGIRRHTSSTTFDRLSSRSCSKESSQSFQSSTRSGSRQSTWSKEEPGQFQLKPPIQSASTNVFLPSLTIATANYPPKYGGFEVRAATLALKYRLTLSEVKHILECWNEAEGEERATTLNDFKKILCAVFHTSEIPTEMLESAFEATNQNVVGLGQRVDNFVSWYVQHMFTWVNLCNADSTLHSSNAEEYALARRYKVCPGVVDRMKQMFSVFDLDKSGRIEYKEFMEMLKSFPGVSCPGMHWKEMDLDRGGDIDFHEFCSWYLKYFAAQARCL